MPSAAFEKELLAQLPKIKRMLGSKLRLSGAPLEDLIQDVALRAWSNAHTFLPGTNMGAWLMVIGSNIYLSHLRKASRITYVGQIIYDLRVVSPNGEDREILRDALEALAKASPEKREAVLLAAAGFTLEEIAELAEVPVGTIKSRIHRGRKALA